jgi:tRNA G10  N-methylase Trm11
MLPPKLAQIMINLAVCSDEQSKKGEKLVYDPFCGTGTVLMESLLMGHSAQGSDIQEVNIVGTNDNIEWLASEAGVDVAKVSRVFELDATKISSADLKDVDCIVTEGFLGVPKQGNEESSALVKELEELGNLYYDFLKAVSSSVKVNNSIVVVLTLPVYRGNGDNSSKNYFIENLVEKFGTLGYSVSALVPENKLGIRHKDSVLYKRSDQKVLRQVYRLTLTSK